MADECLSYLRVKPGGVYIDGTIGGAGHALRILERLGGGGAALIGVDCDGEAVAVSERRLRERNEELGGSVRCAVVRSNYVNIDKICNELGVSGADGILLDLGVSSHQLDDADRGFSFRQDAPLDMRMDLGAKLTAADIVNRYTERELANVIYKYGEERWAARIAAFIAERRSVAPVLTTGDLVGVICAAIPKKARRDGPHPARRTFQALRIEVNDELGVIAKTIRKSSRLLRSGGRLCVISFHSLEDRIVKETIAELSAGCSCPDELPVCVCGGVSAFRKVTKKPAQPSEGERASNPRARSAKLRVAEKT